MKIQKIQKLNSLVPNQQSDNSVSNTRDFRIKNYSEQVSPMNNLSLEALKYSSSLSFESSKGTTVKDGKKIIKSVKKMVGDISKQANPKDKRGDTFLDSPFFDSLLNVVDYQTVVMATVAAIACAARGSLISILPTKTNKEDNMWAASHSWASGIIGFIAAFVITAPFKLGHGYVMKHLKQDLSKKTLQRLYPHLDIKSIEKDGKRLAIDDWKDICGNKFIDDIKGCEKLPKLTNLADACESTFKNILHVDVDWASQKGKSFNDVITRDGKKLYDVISMSRLGINVKEEGMCKAQVLLKEIDKEYLESLIKSAKEDKSAWGELDIKSVYNSEGRVNDFREWKDLKGNQWKLDLDSIGVSSPYETADYRVRVSGAKRFDKKDKIYKFVAYQKNGAKKKLGTPITNAMVENDRANDGLFTLLTWLPDLVTRIPVAMATIAIIPWVLRNALHLKKSTDKKVEDTPKQTTAQENTKIQTADKKVSFKGKANNGLWKNFVEWLGKTIGKYYGKPLIESERPHKLSARLSDLPGSVTQHMAALGSLITSSAYMHQTLTKKDIDPDRRRTLAVNQGLCFAIPTAAAYTVNAALNDWVKSRIEYRYVGLKERKIDIGKLESVDPKIIAEEVKTLSHKTKGIRMLASIAIFTMIYRFITPILMTPVANRIGDKWNARQAEQRKLREQQRLNQSVGNEVKKSA